MDRGAWRATLHWESQELATKPPPPLTEQLPPKRRVVETVGSGFSR